MKLDSKSYRIIKTKNYLKKNNFFFLVNTINHDSTNWVTLEQNLKTLNFNYYKVFNKLNKNIFKNSTYNSIQIVHGITVFVKPTRNSKPQTKQIILTNFELLLFNSLAIKLNNKIYTTTHFKSVNSLDYIENKLKLYQLKVLNLKLALI